MILKGQPTADLNQIRRHLRISAILILGTLLLWWSGIAGSTLYAVPALGLIGYLIFLILNGNYPAIIEIAAQHLLSLSLSAKCRKWILIIFSTQALLWLVFVIFKYYSFSLYSLDAGYHSNILFNISQGEFFSSYSICIVWESISRFPCLLSPYFIKSFPVSIG